MSAWRADLAVARKEDPRVTDLNRYRRARERARRQPTARPQPANQGFLGPRKNAGLILALVILVMLALWLGPYFL